MKILLSFILLLLCVHVYADYCYTFKIDEHVVKIYSSTEHGKSIKVDNNKVQIKKHKPISVGKYGMYIMPNDVVELSKGEDFVRIYKERSNSLVIGNFITVNVYIVDGTKEYCYSAYKWNENNSFEIEQTVYKKSTDVPHMFRQLYDSFEVLK